MFTNVGGYISVECSQGAQMLLPDSIAKKLCLPKLLSGRVIGKCTYSMNVGYNNVHMMSNIVESQPLSETSAPIIATLPTGFDMQNPTRSLYFEIMHLKWKRVTVDWLDRLIIQFVTTDLQPATFLGCSTMLTLGFKSL